MNLSTFNCTVLINILLCVPYIVNFILLYSDYQIYIYYIWYYNYFKYAYHMYNEYCVSYNVNFILLYSDYQICIYYIWYYDYFILCIRPNILYKYFIVLYYVILIILSMHIICIMNTVYNKMYFILLHIV